MCRVTVADFVAGKRCNACKRQLLGSPTSALVPSEQDEMQSLRLEGRNL